MAISSVSDREFSQEVLQHDAPVVVAFRAAWCVPSQQLAPLVDDIADRYAGRVKVVGVDVDSDPKADKLCRQYKVTRLPMVMVFREGRVADFIGGAASPDNVADMIDRQLRPVTDVNEYNFDAEVLKSPVPVLVHVDAAWCAQSRALIPDVEQTAERFRGRVKVVRLDFGPANARLCAQYGFLRVPTLAVFHRGQVEDQIFGPMEGGTKTEAVRTSCVGLTATDNIAEMLEPFAL
jgi:thioredoxin 1